MRLRSDGAAKRCSSVCSVRAVERAATYRQIGGRCVRDGEGRCTLPRLGEWHSSRRTGGRPLAYGLRNAHLAGTLEEIVRELGAVRVEADADTFATADGCRALARGSRPLVVNAGPRPLVAKPAPPEQLVLAVQQPLVARRREALGILGDRESFLGTILRDGRNDVGVFNPIVDPLSPEADYYGIVYRIVPAAPPPDRERALGALRDELIALSTALGFEAVDPEETEGAAVVPCSPWHHDGRVEQDVLELARIYDAGAPIITGDGMARAGIAALVAAECVLAGEDPVANANRALARWRTRNRLLAFGMTTGARPFALGVGWLPSVTLRGGVFPDSWAGIELARATPS